MNLQTHNSTNLVKEISKSNDSMMWRAKAVLSKEEGRGGHRHVSICKCVQTRKESGGVEWEGREERKEKL